jgi:poly(3-hydroxyalkanoate) synthetase
MAAAFNMLRANDLIYAGHMAGVISPPGTKYGHWANDNLPLSPDAWFAGATPNQGSWWPRWDEWVTQLMQAAFQPASPAAVNYQLSKTRRALTSA